MKATFRYECFKINKIIRKLEKLKKAVANFSNTTTHSKFVEDTYTFNLCTKHP